MRKSHQDCTSSCTVKFIKSWYLCHRIFFPQSINEQRDFSDGGLVVRNRCPHRCGPGLFPGQGSLSSWGFPGGSDGKESACSTGDPGLIVDQEDPLEKGIATHSSILAWRIPWTEEAGSLQLQRVGHDWASNMGSPVVTHLSFHYRCTDSVPGQGTESLNVTWGAQKINENKY